MSECSLRVLSRWRVCAAGSGGVAAAVTLLAACIPVPTPGWVRSEIPAATIAAIEPGKTTRADVLLALGDPEDHLAGDMGLVYQWAEVLGTVSFWTGVPMAVPVAGMSGDVCHKLVVQFHPTGEVVRAKRFKGQTSFPSWVLGIETGVRKAARIQRYRYKSRNGSRHPAAARNSHRSGRDGRTVSTVRTGRPRSG